MAHTKSKKAHVKARASADVRKGASVERAAVVLYLETLRNALPPMKDPVDTARAELIDKVLAWLATRLERTNKAVGGLGLK